MHRALRGGDPHRLGLMVTLTRFPHRHPSYVCWYDTTVVPITSFSSNSSSLCTPAPRNVARTEGRQRFTVRLSIRCASSETRTDDSKCPLSKNLTRPGPTTIGRNPRFPSITRPSQPRRQPSHTTGVATEIPKQVAKSSHRCGGRGVGDPFGYAGDRLRVHTRPRCCSSGRLLLWSRLRWWLGCFRGRSGSKWGVAAGTGLVRLGRPRLPL